MPSPASQGSAPSQASRQRRKLHDDIVELQAQLDEQAVIIEKIYKQNKKMAKRMQMMSIVGWARVIFLYLPIIALLLYSIFFLPSKIREIMSSPFDFLLRGDTSNAAAEEKLQEKSTVDLLLERVSPAQLGDIQDALKAITNGGKTDPSNPDF